MVSKAQIQTLPVTFSLKFISLSLSLSLSLPRKPSSKLSVATELYFLTSKNSSKYFDSDLSKK